MRRVELTASAAAAGTGTVAPVGTLTNTTVGASSPPTFGASSATAGTGAPATTDVNTSGANPTVTGSSAGGIVVSPGTTPIGPQPTTATANRPLTSGAPTQPNASDPAALAGEANAASRATGVEPAPQTTATDPGSVGLQPTGRLGASPTGISVPMPPPAATPEMVPVPPSPNQTWIRGHYIWDNDQWTWVGGAWAVTPQPGAVWVDGRYDPKTQRWLAGHWEASRPGVTLTNEGCLSACAGGPRGSSHSAPPFPASKKSR